MCSRTHPAPQSRSNTTTEVRQCPDCAGTGRRIVEGQTLLAASRPCGTCASKGHVEVIRWGSQTTGWTHYIIASTDRCLCGQRIPQARGALLSTHDCLECGSVFRDLAPTAWQRKAWYLDVDVDVEDLP